LHSEPNLTERLYEEEKRRTNALLFRFFSKLLELLNRVRSAASVAARLLLVDFWTNATHTEPAFAALMAAEFLLTPGRGDVYSLDDASAWFQKTGWRPFDHKPLTGPASLLVAEAV
jgi:hypothetical protein